MIALLCPGEFDLGHHGDEVRGRIGHDGPVLRLRPEAAGILRTAARPHRAPAADRGQPGEAVDRQPEALVVAEVQVQYVDLVGGDLADELLDRGRRLVVPGDVEQQAPVGVPGVVGDGGHGSGPGPRHDRGAVDPRGQELAERLNAVVQPVRSRGLDPRPRCRGVDPVALGPVAGLERPGVADLQDNVAWVRPAGDGGQPVAGRGAQVRGQVAGDRQFGRGVSTWRGDDPGVPGEGEVAAADLRGYRLRHDVERAGRGGGGPHRRRPGGQPGDGGGDAGHQDGQARSPSRQQRQAACAATAGAGQRSRSGPAGRGSGPDRGAGPPAGRGDGVCGSCWLPGFSRGRRHRPLRSRPGRASRTLQARER